MIPSSVAISNGFSKFHLARAAAEMKKRGLLAAFLTGAYPPEWMMRHYSRFSRNVKLARLLARFEPIEQQHIYSDGFSEMIHVAGGFLRRTAGVKPMGEYLERHSLRIYGRRAVHRVRKAARAGCKLYHYRAGFGHASVVTAKEAGMELLCDHSIVHPALMEGLVQNCGRLPETGHLSWPMSPFWCDILTDINQAGHVLVNSDFVKSTFLHQGWDSSKVHVIYLGVDDNFFQDIPTEAHRERNFSGALNLLFAGFFGHRKGAEILIKSLTSIDDLPWRLEIAGPIDPAIRSNHKEFLQDSRVVILGNLSRLDLAGRMAAAEVFVFPSLAEGSARVAFEALACGCYLITTPNTGSIVEDGVHGALVPPGDSNLLAAAIRQAYDSRREISAIGRSNAELISVNYRQNHYGDALVDLYNRLLG